MFVKGCPCLLPTLEQQLNTHSFQGTRMTTNIDILTTLGLSHVEMENQRTKRRAWMLGFKATRYHEKKIRNIRQHELPHLRAMVGLQANVSTSQFTPLVSPFFFERLG